MNTSTLKEENTKPGLLIVDDDEDIRTQMRWALNPNHDVVLAGDRAGALEQFKEKKPPVVLLDLGLPPHPGTPQEGLATLADLLAADGLAKVIIITGQSEKEVALKAIGEGAYDFLCKPVEMDELKIILKRAYHIARLEREFRKMQERLNAETFEGMLGTSRQMQEVFSSIRKVATAEAPVLILGESGTGKEMAALAIHHRSRRKEGPFIAINCGAIPETLLEAELFGHEKGAFTGAHIQRQGRIEMAAGGTLFLDEIGELPTSLQVKLLRFLQEQQIERIGGRKEIHVDTRVIAATNTDLTKAMKEGKFREDLYYRLAVVVIKLPSLRERENDVPVLARAFLQKFAGQNNKSGLKFNPDALSAIGRYGWPGNVRELENRVRRAVIMAESSRVTAADLELTSLEIPTEVRGLKAVREEVERELVQRALLKHDGKISPAAADLGISRPTLYELIEKLGIKKEPAQESGK